MAPYYNELRAEYDVIEQIQVEEEKLASYAVEIGKIYNEVKPEEYEHFCKYPWVESEQDYSVFMNDPETIEKAFDRKFKIKVIHQKYYKHLNFDTLVYFIESYCIEHFYDAPLTLARIQM